MSKFKRFSSALDQEALGMSSEVFLFEDFGLEEHIELVNSCSAEIVTVKTSNYDSKAIAKLDPGFIFSEIQFALTSPRQLTRRLKPEFRVGASTDVDWVGQQILEGIFTSDRYSLDHRIGPEKSRARYKHWLLQEIQSGADLMICSHNDIPFGFFTSRLDQGECRVAMSGLFVDSQKPGLGHILHASIFEKATEISDNPFSASVSSNNSAALRIHFDLGFTLHRSAAVFTRVRAQ